MRRACSPPGLVWLCAAGTFAAAAAPASAQALELCSEERLEKRSWTGGEERGFNLFPGRPGVFAFEPPRPAAGVLTAAPARFLRLPLPFDPAGPAAPGAAPKKHFWIATGEVVMLNVGTWLVDRYLLKAPWAFISLATWKANLKAGLVYDHVDDFPTNQAEHPFHGSFYYNAGRTNGFNFWESALFAAAGSLQFEYFAENEPASLNDLINTSLGGAVTGEVFYRLSTMLVDNTASGGSRLWREIGAFVMNPIAGFNRFFRGETKKDFPNPDHRMPAGFSAELYAGYQHLGDGPPSVVLHPNQGLFGVLIRYGDAFSGENRKPFDYFEALLEVTPRSNSTASRWQERGLLASWGLSSSAAAEHRLGLFMGYEYTNNQSQIFSTQTLSANLLSRFPLSRGLELRMEILAAGFPVAALQADDTPEELAAIGRPYDYGQGGGVRSLARLHRGGLDLFSIGYEALWIHTSSGASLSSRLKALRLEGRLPVHGALAAGAAWTWNDRVTVYENRTVEVQGAEWRVFASLLLR
ncbi:MAG: DUF3943 domain-containing protein [Thermoanaerobaculia bacterium]